MHFGRIAHEDIVEALVSDVNRAAPDLVVVAGDLTQRARKKELSQAAELLEALNAAIVIPGNHDVFAWWFPVRRLFNPLARYRKYISPDVDAELVRDDVAVLALNSSYGWTVKSGRFSKEQLVRAQSFFTRTQDAPTKLLVVHHHLISQADVFARHDVARNGDKLLSLALEWGVDAILSGHLHQSHACVVTEGRQSTVLVSSGTATSDRGRRADAKRNIFELITLVDEPTTGTRRMTVEERLFDIQKREFARGDEFVFNRETDAEWKSGSESSTRLSK